jgi:hypothetical protein
MFHVIQEFRKLAKPLISIWSFNTKCYQTVNNSYLVHLWIYKNPPIDIKKWEVLTKKWEGFFELVIVQL